MSSRGSARLQCHRSPAPQTRALRLRRGINLWPWFSLTREFPAPRTDYDWPPFQPDRAIPVRADLAALRSAGIDFVRLPVDPGPLLAFSGAQRERLFADILGAVELANDEALTVIVNLHPNGATHHYNPRNLVGDVTAPLFARYLGLVRDAAARLARFDPARVAFEPLNEPPQSCGAADWGVMQSELLRTARAAAPNLTLVATGACGGMIAGLEALDPARIVEANIVYTFHFYEPYVFSHQGAPWMSGEPIYRYLNAVPWPASAGAKQKTLAAVAARMAADAKTPAAEKREIAATVERVLDEYFNANPDKRFIERYFARVTAWADRHRVARDARAARRIRRVALGRALCRGARGGSRTLYPGRPRGVRGGGDAVGVLEPVRRHGAHHRQLLACVRSRDRRGARPARLSMIPKSGYRFSEKIMLH